MSYRLATRCSRAAAPGRGRGRVQVQCSTTMKFGNVKNERLPREGNVDGDFYVDRTCIDCDTCRWMAPATFTRVGGGSSVTSQPKTKDERVDAMKALLSCPTFSIHVRQRSSEELRAAQEGLPSPIPGLPNVYHCGWHSVTSYAGTPYLITRPASQGGNILIDSPRYNPVLARRLEEMGGVAVMFLTHRDDVGDHEKWAAHFKCRRVIHALEPVPGMEVVLQGEGPWTLEGTPLEQADLVNPPEEAEPDVTLIFTPGHTQGHVCLYYAPAKAMFTGDHLCQDDEALEDMQVFTDFNWYSVSKQLDSVRKLLQYDYLHVLPAHGRQLHLRDAAHRLEATTRLLQKHGHTTTASATA
uniref:Metallo-beta-lactamase domain-containing protein n=1 Tax=Chlamydomonas chlamydogama TaxID=225041 RepID=A0A7S2QTB2_9CHLO|mmetsp:Transcript_1571/g.3557  ORF Transcript_1571/g.3557 Transcript_1571/m.3557 type:complete len:355 (+) Transcript_1571:33-1097(+)